MRDQAEMEGEYVERQKRYVPVTGVEQQPL
jgi:hypothetical protein